MPEYELTHREINSFWKAGSTPCCGCYEVVELARSAQAKLVRIQGREMREIADGFGSVTLAEFINGPWWRELCQELGGERWLSTSYR